MGIGTAKSIFHQAIIFWFFELKFASEWCGCKTSNWDERKNSEQKLEAFFGREWLRKKRVTEVTSRLLYLSIYGLHPCVLAMNTFLVLGSSALFAAAFPITFSSYTLLFSRLLMITVWRLLERHTKERAKNCHEIIVSVFGILSIPMKNELIIIVIVFTCMNDIKQSRPMKRNQSAPVTHIYIYVIIKGDNDNSHMCHLQCVYVRCYHIDKQQS